MASGASGHESRGDPAAGGQERLGPGVSPTLARFSAKLTKRWAMLQELSGVRTPFRGPRPGELLSEVEASHQEEIQALRAEEAQARAEVEAGYRCGTPASSEDRLLELVSRATPRESDGS